MTRDHRVTNHEQVWSIKVYTTKQLCVKLIYEKKYVQYLHQTERVPTCLNCDVTYLSLTTKVVTLDIQSCMASEREERRQAR